MNIVDIVVIILILLGGLIGLKRGFTKELVSCLGFLLVVILAFYLKNPVSVFLYEHLPFFSFGGVLKGVTVLNIAVYEIIAFFVVFAILMILLKVLLLATSIFEKFLTMTIILGIPSKILGAILGMIQWFVIVFVGLYVLSLPFFNVKIVEESKFANKILNHTPVLSGILSKGVGVINEFGELKTKFVNDTNPNQFNLETLDLFLKYKVVEVKSIDKLVKNGKIKIDGVENVLVKYREG